MPKPARPEKKVKKLLSQEVKSTMEINSQANSKCSLPIGHPSPLVKSPQHAKWPALFKKHLGVLESHVRALDRVMQNVKSEMADLPENEKLDFELGEKGNWRIICGMMDRAREALTSARTAAQGIVPSKHLQDKKGLGIIGTSFDRLEPRLDQKAVEIGYNPVGKGKLDRNPDDVDEEGDSEMMDALDSSDDSEAEGSEHDAVAENAEFIQLSIGSKIPRFSSVTNGTKSAEEEKASAVEANPYFVVDVEPTPVNLEPTPPKKSRKQLKEEAALARNAAREAKKAAYEASKLAPPKEPTPQPQIQPEQEVDFAALEASLQAEIAAATKKQEEDAKEEKKSKKKRRRSSGVDEEVVEKKVKLDKKEKKRRVEDSADTEEEAKKEKKEKKDKKEKKRKAEDSADGEEVEEGAKKKRKHKGNA
ncbi:hypothetical protein BKA64DRAFT_688271 [Cadophora sp. MPI-SDFR-AT-0126]|nr:hypothetical protein BKA64DRAFT_688271 [Leotiomycetes sp. MPI-SDFR-AT-0126]